MASAQLPTASDARGRVVEAALALFDERGISATGIADIQTRANVSVGSIYHHFGGKEGIAGDAFLSVLAEYQQAFCSALPADAEAERGIRAGVRAHLRWTSANPLKARYLATFHKRALDPGRTERLRELNERLYDHIDSWWALRADSGELVPAKLPLSYALWLGPAQELCRLWLATPAPEPGQLERFSAPLCDGAWKAVRAG